MKFYLLVLIMTFGIFANLTAVSNGEYEEIITNLSSINEEIRNEAIDKLNTVEFSREQKFDMIKKAAKKYPELKYSWESIPQILVENAVKNGDKEFIPKIVEAFGGIDALAKTEGLRYLDMLNTEESIKLYMDLLLKYKDSIDIIPITNIEKETTHSKIIFPKIFQGLSNKKLHFNIYLLTLTYLENNAINVDGNKEFIENVLKESRENYNQILKLQSLKKDKNWIWDIEEYNEIREDYGLLLDLFGYIKNEEIKQELYKALDLLDAKEKYFAISSLLNQNVTDINKKYFEEVAADPEIRNSLYNKLKQINKLQYYPKKYLTQAYFAEADMIKWLSYPTELGRFPDEIELMRVIRTNIEDKGDVEFYLYKFKSRGSKELIDAGWLAGMAGYYVKKEKPTTDNYGFTFSNFEKWDGKTADEHVNSMVESVVGMYKNNKE